MVVNSDMRHMRSHGADRAVPPHVEKCAITGRIELQYGGSELEPLRPFRPPATYIASFHRVDRSAILRLPRPIEFVDLRSRSLKQAPDACCKVRRIQFVNLHGMLFFDPSRKARFTMPSRSRFLYC